MRIPRAFVPAACLLATFVASPTASAGHRDLGRETLDANDGWASFGTGTTGGSAAAPEQVYIVHDRQELVAALNNGIYPPPSTTPSNVPKIIYVVGTIDVNVDDANQPLECPDYYRNGYTLEAFLAAYDPAGDWGRVNPAGPLEMARNASRMEQEGRVRMRVGSNTTIVGVGSHAVLKGVWLDIRGQVGVAGSRTNIIIRNLTFRDTYDCFPVWAPNDGAAGNWNALYDSVSLRDSDHVWVDHNTFEDVLTADETLPHHFGVLYQVHDGLLDITNGSDHVTVSWNRFRNHDKTMLIGSSDSAPDVGKLRVTFHHNSFESLGQRVPRVRFGQVHVYNNFYEIENVGNYGYSWGVGVQSAIFAENNFFKTDQAISPDMFIERFNGTAIQARGTLVNGFFSRDRVDVVAAWNDVNDPDLLTTVAWTPTLFKRIDPTWTVPLTVKLFAGPFFWFLP